MSKHKLHSVKKVYAQQEKALTEELARLKRERQEQQSQAQALKDMLVQYRDQHRARGTLSAAEALRFHKFYQRMTDAVGAQQAFVRRLDMAVDGKQAEWQDSYRQRRGIELVLERSAAEEALSARRRDRRRGVVGRGGPDDSGGWTMLKAED